MTTMTVIGTLRTEGAPQYEEEGAGSRPRIDFRPERTPLLNDGKWHFWMAPGEDYEIDRDDAGWRVTCRTWGDGHTYRLADAATWELADRLPVDASGWLGLHPSRRYVLTYDAVSGTWTVNEA